MSATQQTFETVRREVYALLTQAQNELLHSPACGMVQRRAQQDALSCISAAKADLLKAAPIATDYPRGCSGTAPVVTE